MIYINNNTEIQTIYIPRQEELLYTHNSSYESGYTDGFESGYTSGVTHQKDLLSAETFTENGLYLRENGISAITVDVDLGESYESGYTDGYESGETHQKGLLSAETFTDNGVYERENGISAITVEVDLNAPYESGYTDGYSSGVEHTQALHTSTAFTENGEYQNENAWSSVTVNLDTAATYNSGFTDGYTSGETHQKSLMTSTALTVNGSYSAENGFSAVQVDVAQTGHTDQELQDAYDSGYTSGETHQKELLTTTAFTQNGSYTRQDGWSGVTVNLDTAATFNQGYQSGVTDGEQNIISTFTEFTATTNGQFGSSAAPITALTVDVSQTGTSAVLTAETFTQNGTYTPSNVTFLDYIETDGYEILFDTGVKMTKSGQTVILDFMPLNGEKHYDAYLSYMSQQDNDSVHQIWLRQASFNNNPSGNYWYSVGGISNQTIRNLFNANVRAYVVMSNTGITVNGVSSAVSTTEVNVTQGNIYLNGDMVGNQNYRCPYARYYGFKLIDDDGTTVLADLRPALDNTTPCFYDMVSETFIHQIGTGTTTGGNVISAASSFDGWSSVTVNVDTASTYNSGFTDGYISGETHQKSLMVSTALTQNGTYSRENGFSSVTVNVEQQDIKKILECKGVYFDFDEPYGIYGLNNVIVSATDLTVIPTTSGVGYNPIIGNSEYERNCSYLDGLDYVVEGTDSYSTTVVSGLGQTISGKPITYSVSSGGTFIDGVRQTYVSPIPFGQNSSIMLFGTAFLGADAQHNYGHGTKDTCRIGTIGFYSGWPVSESNCIALYEADSDGNGNPCLIDKISGCIRYPIYDTPEIGSSSCTLLTQYEVGFGDGYVSGYSSGYSSGYTDGAASSSGGSTADTQMLKTLIDRSITGVTFPSGLTKLGDYIFCECRSLSSITIPNGITEICNYAFQRCFALTSVTLPYTLTKIGNYVFSPISGLKDFEIPDSVTDLGMGVFSGCSELSAITIGSGVSTYNLYVFNNCKKLKTIYFRNSSIPRSVNVTSFPSGSTYADSGDMYVPSGSSGTYSTWATTDNTAKKSFSGWTIHEFVVQ